MIGGRPDGCKAGTLAGRADALLAGAVVAAGLLLCGARALGRAASLAAADPPPDPAAVAHRVDLATAGPAELMLLPGVGPKLAAALAGEREARGPFASLEDVDRRVPGVGPARVRWWRGRVAGPGGRR
jgi:DNA uptake protein ComE-like DNA-binding protein